MKKRRKNLTIGIWAMAASLAVQGTIPIYAAGKSEIDNSFVLISNQESMENSATEKLKAELGKNTFVESNLAIKPEAAWKFKTAFMNCNLSSQKATLSQAYREESIFLLPGESEKKEEPTNSILENLVQLYSVSTGDLWEDWDGDFYFPGEGTQSIPYQLSTPEHLMALSEAVAAGVNFKGIYFEMIQDIDLGSLEAENKTWNPIGWYQNKKELGEKVSHGFSGNFDGCNNTITGLQIHRQEGDYIGLFGWIDGGNICNLRIEAGEIYGAKRVGILAGAITGDSYIYHVQVSGRVQAKGDAGGIVGAVDGEDGRVTIENCSAEKIIILSEEDSSFVGGIAGQTIHADLVDNRVITLDDDENHIQGKGYIGGIVGRMSSSNLYNSYVQGKIGGIGAKAIGGIAGIYESGNLILARFAGEIGRTYQGAKTKEGTFVGTRQGIFSYGTEKENNLSYLFTDTEAKAITVVGSGQDGDNIFTKDAHIGYWTDHETRYVTVAGITRTKSDERYFYEELEDGVRYIVTNKLGNEFTAEGCSKNSTFCIDHFAPGYQGEPVKGYLLSIPRIDARNTNGTYDTDVALLTAIPSGANTYYRMIDKDHSAAVAPGEIILVATAAKNKDKYYYQMVMDETEPGRVKPPSYSSESGEWIPMTYVNGGNYSFEMPEHDTELHVEYLKVTTKIGLSPTEAVVSVIQTRKGDRKNPEIVTEVQDELGNVIARYINRELDSTIEVQPIRIHGEHNTTGSTSDQSLKWSVDDKDLLLLMSDTEYTLEDAKIIPNMESTFIQEILNREARVQAENGYLEAISPVVYEQSAIVTAASNPATSIDNKAVYANCKVTVTLQILDETITEVEGLNLNQNNLVFKVIRRLTGDRKNPEQTFICTESQNLLSNLYPQQPFYQNVIWKAQDNSELLTLVPEGEFQQNCTIRIEADMLGKEKPSWIQTVMEADDRIKREDPYRKLEGNAVYHGVITATTHDQSQKVVEAECNITIFFETDDQTVILPEQIEIQPLTQGYDLSAIKYGNRENPNIEYKGFEKIQLQALVAPDCPMETIYEPYDKSIAWSSTEPEVLSVSEEGILQPNREAKWIQELINEAAEGENITVQKTVVIQAATGQVTDTIEIPLTLTVEDKTTENKNDTGQSSSSGSSGGSFSKKVIKSYGIKGDNKTNTDGVMTGHSLASSMTGSPNLGMQSSQGIWKQDTDGYWTLTVDGRVCRDEWVYVQNPYADIEKGQSILDWFRFDSQGHMVTGWFMDKDGHQYYLNPISDNTKGRMMTGWNWIVGKDRWLRCYYFQEQANGYRGALFEDTSTPDGYTVNEQGEWIVDDNVQIK